MSFKHWLTIITFVLLVGTVVLGWSEIVQAFRLMGEANIWLLLSMIPLQIIGYYATGGVIFSYLRAKGDMKQVNRAQMTRMALELNFVNHILPSGGAVGFTYMSWALSRFGVRAGRATMAQVVRYALTFATFFVLLIVSVIWLAIDHEVDRVVYMLCAALAVMSIASVVGLIYLFKSRKHLTGFASWLDRVFNKIASFFTRRRKKRMFKKGAILEFFEELHDDYAAIRKDKKVLVKPFIWALTAHIADIVLFSVAFWALGYWINPSVVFISFGLQSIAAFLSVTPAGAGASDAVMILFFAAAGVPLDIALAGTLLSRVILVMGTILFGYFFYQHTISTHGKAPIQRQ